MTLEKGLKRSKKPRTSQPGVPGYFSQAANK